MKSALLWAMIDDGWRLGYPVAIAVESRMEDGKLYLEQAFVGIITDADHDGIRLNSQGSVCCVSLRDVEREIFECGRRCWMIKTATGEIKIGQAFTFAKQVAFWAQELAFAQRGPVSHA